jgi:hypothetical protein
MLPPYILLDIFMCSRNILRCDNMDIYIVDIWGSDLLRNFARYYGETAKPSIHQPWNGGQIPVLTL